MVGGPFRDDNHTSAPDRSNACITAVPGGRNVKFFVSITTEPSGTGQIAWFMSCINNERHVELTQQPVVAHKALIANGNEMRFAPIARGKGRYMRSVCDPVHAEQVRSSYAHLPLTLSVSVLNSALLGFVLATTASEFNVLIWIGLVAGLSILRLVLWDVHRRLDVGPDHDPLWTRLAFAGTVASGILWGSGMFVFSPLDVTHLLFLTLVVSGMCAGAATVHAAYFPLVVGFILPAIAPLTVNFFMQGNRLQVVSGIMTCIFGMSLCVASLTFGRWFSEITSARLALALKLRRLAIRMTP